MVMGGETKEIQMIGYEYGDDSPLHKLEKGDTVVMTDISLPADQMQWIYTNCNLIWIDHHKSAMAAALDYEYGYCNGKRKVGDSASYLAWTYYFPNENIPSIVYWVDRYDVWKQGEDWDDVMAAQYGMRMHMENPNNDKAYKLWESFLVQEIAISNIIDDGGLLLKYERQQNKIKCSKAFDLEWEGLKFAAINNTMAGSTVLDSYANEDHDALMVFGYDGEKWKFSMYQNIKSPKKIDLSLIAVKHGGGGHSGACGFMKDNVRAVLP